MTLKRWMACAFLVTSGIAHSAEVVDDSASVIGAAKVEEMSIAALNVFKDPQSVQFKDLSHPELSPGVLRKVTVCGMVNARNSFGGYNGFTPFVYSSDSKSFTVYDPQIQPPLRKLHLLVFNYSNCDTRLGVPSH